MFILSKYPELFTLRVGPTRSPPLVQTDFKWSRKILLLKILGKVLDWPLGGVHSISSSLFECSFPNEPARN